MHFKSRKRVCLCFKARRVQFWNVYKCVEYRFLVFMNKDDYIVYEVVWFYGGSRTAVNNIYYFVQCIVAAFRDNHYEEYCLEL